MSCGAALREAPARILGLPPEPAGEVFFLSLENTSL